MKITPTALSVTQILSSTSEQYVIPAYQRRYSWGYNQLAALWDDIDVLDGNDTHLLGTIVCLAGHHSAGLNQLELVDGQQRLTSLCIVLYCIVERLEREGETDEASDLRRLLSAKALGGPPQSKLLVDSLDAEQFKAHALGNQPDQVANPKLESAFKTVRKWVEDTDLSELGAFLYKLKNQALIIRLDVSEAKDAFKLFETINNRGLRLSQLDIIKNFVLGNAARFGADELEFSRKQWGHLIAALDGLDTIAFLRAFLSVKTGTRVTRSMVIDQFKTLFMSGVSEATQLREHGWFTSEDEEDDVEPDDDAEGEVDDGDEEEAEETEVSECDRVPLREFLQSMVEHATKYREIHNASTGKPKIDRRLRNLRLIRALQSYPFLLFLRVSDVSDRDFEVILKLTEALLLRRHICKERSNEAEQMFASLTRADPGKILAAVKKTYREFSPADDLFAIRFAATRFNGALKDRARYCLEQFELVDSPHGETTVCGSDEVHIEHIIPQRINTARAIRTQGNWPEYLGNGATEHHRKHLWQIGNLTLIAGELNIGASNNPYARKKQAYKSSALGITASLPGDYPEFRYKQVEARSAKLARLAVELWPIP
jgi:hypothetical protein